MRFSPPCSATPSTSMRCGGSSGVVISRPSARLAFASPLPNSVVRRRRRQIRRRRNQNNLLDCSALFDGLFGKPKQKTATSTTTTSAPPTTPPPIKKASSPPPPPAFKSPPATAEDGSALPPPYHEAVLLTRPCPSGDGGAVALVFCCSSGGGGGGDGGGGGGGGGGEDGSCKVDAAALEALCDAVGWPRRPAAAVEAALRGSFVVASLVARKVPASSSDAPSSSIDSDPSVPPPPPPPPSPADRLVGLARATSDRAFNATIWDVLVHPDWQGLGLGSALVERTTAALLRAGVGNVTLFAASDAVEFYEALGYEADPDGIRGMFYAGK